MISGNDNANQPPEDRGSAFIEDTDKHFNPPGDGNDPEDLPKDKGKGRDSNEHPNRTYAGRGDGGDDGDDRDDNSDDSDSDDSETQLNNHIARSMWKGLSDFFSGIGEQETARTSPPDTFDGSDLKTLNTFFIACATTFIARPKDYKKQ